jgi:hypothetical protein
LCVSTKTFPLLTQLEGVIKIQGHRLIANNVEPRFEEGLGRRKVREVRRYDRNEINALTDRQFGFRFGHRLIAVVNTFWVEQQQRAALVRFAARRCTAPMNASLPPPTIPIFNLRDIYEI